MTDRPCAIGNKPHPADHGHLCDHHETTLRDILRDIENETLHLTPIPSMAIRLGNGHHALASERANGRLNVVAMNDHRTTAHGPRPAGPACHTCWHDTCMIIRRWQDAYDAQAIEIMSILGTLHGWGDRIRAERNMTGPQHITVTGERDWLDRQLIWATEQPWVGEMYGDMRKLLAQIQGANATGPDKPHCACPVIAVGTPCRGEVWIHDELQLVWRRYYDRCARTWEHAPGAATCDTCGATWTTPADKARLQRMIDDAATELARPHTADGRPMRTAAELATDLGLHVTAIRMRLSRAGIKAGRAGYYDPAVLDQREKETA